MRKRLEIAFPNAAGVDVGASSHFVAVPADRAEEAVRQFEVYTADLQALGDWLHECGVDTVAMESTGVYWIALYEMLERRGFKVHLVDTRHVKNVPGRKSDVLDCQWLQQLMSFGLLSGAYRPADEVCVLRAVTRHRDALLRAQAREIQRMQKALVQMNLQLTEVLSDVTVALSVITSTNSSSSFTAWPGFTFQLTISPSAMPSPMSGSLNSLRAMCGS